MLKEENGYQAWLRHAALPGRKVLDSQRRASWRELLATIEVQGIDGRDQLALQAIDELKAAARKMLGIPVELRFKPGSSKPVATKPGAAGAGHWNPELESFSLKASSGITMAVTTSRGFLYAVFRLLELVAAGTDPQSLDLKETPANPLRMINQWDNMDGSVERGYAGNSIFYRNGRIVSSKKELQRLSDYGRLLASVGINAIAINNVNVHATESLLLTKARHAELAKVLAAFGRWGIRVFLSANYASPIQVGGLKTADPLDPAVATWWVDQARELWAALPELGGFLVKADSEGRPGPFTYQRTHADGANMLARAVAPYGGLVMWRCFVYNCRQDWRDRKTDRARAAYDHFLPLDGQFADNVLLQIKNGPMDFQVREATSPLFGAMTKTNQLLELQITQEYTGQQRHLCCLLPMWRQVLDFQTNAKTSADPAGAPIRAVASGRQFQRPLGGMTAVSNIGNDINWTGHHLAQANLFIFGRLAWSPDCDGPQLLKTWASLSFGQDEKVVAAVCAMLESSWATYEDYTAPLGVGWMVTPHYHYGPDVDGYEYSRWGTYHFADRNGIGVDRTQASGTGFTAQYREPNASRYENLATCPDELVLFFHHVPWTHVLHSGLTVIQHIYDRHFAGVEAAEKLRQTWKSLEGRIDARRYREVLERLDHQVSHAADWRDQINTYCFRKSGIPDAKGRLVHP